MKLAGIFNSVTSGISHDLQAVYILGKYNPAELTYTSQDPIAVTLSGFRVVNNGPFVIASAPHLQDLLNSLDFQLVLVDRQTGASLMNVTGCKVSRWSTTHAVKALADLSVDVLGISLEDEAGPSNDQGSVTFG